jgi:enediyne biosynthesis protein E4
MLKFSIHLILPVALICVQGCTPTAPISESASKVSSQAIEVTREQVARIPDAPLFRDLASERGIVFHHAAGTTGQFLMPEIMGSGAALLDFDLDGDLDVYLANGGPTASLSLNSGGANQLFRQSDDGQFENVTQTVGGGDEHFGMGVAAADVNNDGYPDLYITNYGPDQLYLNDKGNRFVNVTADAGISNDRWSVSAAFADINRDGWLDLYVANYVDYDASHECPTADGLPDYCNPLQFPGTTDLMLVNTGTTIERDGLRIPTFRDMSLESGIASAKGAGLGVALIDAN